MTRPSLDLSDPVAFGRWLSGLRSAFHDLDAVGLDMLRAPRQRRLGPHNHRKLYTEAAKSMESLLAYATPPPEEPEPSDPAGSPGH